MPTCRKTDEALYRLTPEQCRVTQQNATEHPGSGEYLHHHEPGVYVDVVSGEPLFTSSDKFESGCGWPGFSKPVEPANISERRDLSRGMVRTDPIAPPGFVSAGRNRSQAAMAQTQFGIQWLSLCVKTMTIVRAFQRAGSEKDKFQILLAPAAEPAPATMMIPDTATRRIERGHAPLLLGQTSPRTPRMNPSSLAPPSPATPQSRGRGRTRLLAARIDAGRAAIPGRQGRSGPSLCAIGPNARTLACAVSGLLNSCGNNDVHANNSVF